VLRILIADDSQMARSGISLLLRYSHEPWEVCGEAGDGEAAVESAKQLQPDLIILDMQMPRMDGITAGREIHALLPEVPIILFTFHDAGYLAPLAKQAGIQQIVQKSDSRALIEAIRTSAGAQSGGGATKTSH
jgi:DNA-binding NarL/FixJ family response regulator